MRTLPWCLALLCLLPQCGGGGPAGSEGQAKSAADVTSSERDSDSDDSERAAGDDANSDVSADKPQAVACDDGTCSPCGDGICPSGWYCDEKASACSWLTECADKPTCGCVTRVLGSACKCREEAGGLRVACD